MLWSSGTCVASGTAVPLPAGGSGGLSSRWPLRASARRSSAAAAAAVRAAAASFPAASRLAASAAAAARSAATAERVASALARSVSACAAAAASCAAAAAARAASASARAASRSAAACMGQADRDTAELWNGTGPCGLEGGDTRQWGDAGEEHSRGGQLYPAGAAGVKLCLTLI